ncbi:RNA-guided endonuclease InsQ/TnpB family protein [Kibdelosporangium aridum]|uniref:RNA-guided endonuclease InsQ/TnpB family protein n=1 Tax=Kibdelosporangium aridum TaxID=2030 RepID=UPI0035E8CCF4
MMLVGRKYRLAFTPEQAQLAETIGGICRSVWNTGLEQRREYRRRGAWINYVEQARHLAEAKAEHDWLKQAPSHVLQQALMDLDRTCRQHGTWKVRWRSARGWSPSFRFSDGKRISVERVGRRWGRAKLPKLGWVRFRWSRCLAESVRSATVSGDGRHWFISFLLDDGTTTPERHARTAVVGVDRFELALRNVARRTCCRVVTVPAPFTSQRCSQCCVVDPKSRESQAGFRCVACGHCENADVNAAKNVSADGLSVSACGDLGATRSMKQEPGGTPRGSTAPIRNVSRLDSAALAVGGRQPLTP